MPLAGATPKLAPAAWHGFPPIAALFETKTASFTATAADSGKTFLIVGATAAVTVTLPAIATGPFYFTIVHLSDVNLTVSAATADTLYTYNDAGTADSVGFETASELIGGTVEVFCDGVIVAALARIASSYQNVTVAT